LEQRLARLGIYTLEDLLFHLPLRYQDRTQITPIVNLHPGVEALIEAEVIALEINWQPRPTLLCRVQDETGVLTLRFFHFNAGQKAQLDPGVRLCCYGEVRIGRKTLEMIHPDYQLLDENKSALSDPTLTPIYPTTEGVSQRTLINLIDQVLKLTSDAPLPDYLPKNLLPLDLPALNLSLQQLHKPMPIEIGEIKNRTHPARQRLVLEELLARQLSMRQMRLQTCSSMARALTMNKGLQQQLLDNIAFSLTAAQRRVISEIQTDLAKSQPMLRLIQGDVGSGKTIVAAIAALQAIGAGFQVAIMAPTELLSEQHYRNFKTWLTPLKVNVHWLAASVKGKSRTRLLTDIQSGKASLVTGTHALFQEKVDFKQLALIIVDEQHRFGVHQRFSLLEKGRQQGFVPHQLSMTATPIPRTLLMSAYANLDTSIIDELPPGRTPVKTVVIAEHRRDEVIERIRLACHTGRQAYWVCTLIEESEALQCQAAEKTAELLSEIMPELHIALIHGRMKSKQKDQIMTDFKAGEIDLLVATTVIEVGVDVANASLMIIENAERLGLTQLHQLRGRVGRGKAQSSCVLLYHPPLSEQARTRLSVMRNTNDGFVIAQHDLDLRGPGEVLGTRQTGLLTFKIADLAYDQHLLPLAQALADKLLRDYPDYAEAIMQRWLSQARHYGTV
jgi:ATP-dependent DNA helicase RecG